MLQVLQCGINVTQNAAQLYLSFNYKSFCKTNQLTCKYIYLVCSFEDTISKIFRNFDQQKLQSYTVYIVQCILCILYIILYTILCILYSVYYTVYNIMLTVECLPCYQLEKHVAKLLCQYATNLICMSQVLQCSTNVTQNMAQLRYQFILSNFNQKV